MKNYTQVYVKNSLEAAQHYCNAFGAQITCEYWNPDQAEFFFSKMPGVSNCINGQAQYKKRTIFRCQNTDNGFIKNN